MDENNTHAQGMRLRVTKKGKICLPEALFVQMQCPKRVWVVPSQGGFFVTMTPDQSEIAAQIMPDVAIAPVPPRHMGKL